MQKTHAFQLAATVVYFSPLQYLFWYDSPEDYDGDRGIRFWEQLPTTWDETIVLHGEIGEYITTARRIGKDWFVGTINSSRPRTLNIPFDFLYPGQKHAVEIYTDYPGADPNRYPVPIQTEKITVQTSDSITVKMLPGGGHAMRIVPIMSGEQ
jgi:alpha-glucosidase